MNEFWIRPGTEADLDSITAIYNEVILNSTAVYHLVPTSVDERAAWFQSRRSAGYPVLVAVQEGELVGFASFAEFRGTWPGYRYSVEHMVHVRADRRGQGIGTGLVGALLPIAVEMGKHVMIGGIDATNESSLRLHERLGFQRVALFREVGRKFGRWLDLVFVERFLDSAGKGRPE